MATIDEKPSNEENEVRLLVQNYMAVYQQIKLAEEGEYDLDTKRTAMAMKYHIFRKTRSEEIALILLNRDLDEYDRKMFERGILQRENPEDRKEPLAPPPARSNYQSDLQSVDDILKYIQLLPCQLDPLKSCKKTIPLDRDIESLVKYLDVKDESFRGLPSNRNECLAMNGQENQVRRQEKRELFTELFERYSKKHGRRVEDEASILKSALKNEIGDEPRKILQPFKSARDLNVQGQKGIKKPKKTLGGKTSVNSPFVLPIKRNKEEEDKCIAQLETMEVDDERLKNIDPKMIELIRNEIMDSGSLVKWEDVAGLEDTKTIIKEVIVYPMMRPDIFQGLRRPPKGILLFGPPGTGKTLIGKCIASQSNSTFFSISASSLTSKWVGEGEKMVRALFAVARVHQPAVIFIDEIDSLLTQRSETEHESSRRIKTEFLVQLDGAATADDDRILVIGATNRPHELDEAARRRFVKRLYVPLPEHQARMQIVRNLLASERHELTEKDVEGIATMAENYSGADMANLCKEASMGPIRSIPFEQFENIRKEDVRGVTAQDFKQALALVRPSVSQADLGIYIQWDATYGSGTTEKR